MVTNINKNVIIEQFVHLIMKCILKEYVKTHYPRLMIKDVMKLILKLNLGIENHKIMTMCTLSEIFTKTPLAKFIFYYF